MSTLAGPASPGGNEALKLQATNPRTNIDEANIWTWQCRAELAAEGLVAKFTVFTKCLEFLFQCHPNPWFSGKGRGRLQYPV